MKRFFTNSNFAYIKSNKYLYSLIKGIAMIAITFFTTNTIFTQTVLNIDTGISYSNVYDANLAAATLNGHTLQIQPANGTFDLSILTANASNPTSINKSLIIDGQGATIDPNCTASGCQVYAFLLNVSTASNITLKNMTLCGFSGNSGAAIKDHFKTGSMVTIENVVVTNSINSSYAVWIENFALINDCSFSNQTGNTGGLRVNVVTGSGTGGSGSPGLTININNSSFDCNKQNADNGSSVSIGNQSNSTPYLNTVNITGGSISNNGGGKNALYLNMGKSSVINITGTTFSYNTSGSSGEASAIYMVRASSPFQQLNLTECVFVGNTGHNNLIKGGISSDYTDAIDCTFIKGGGTSSSIDENSSGSIVNCRLYGVSHNNSNGGNTIVGSGGTTTNTGTYNIPGHIAGTCSTSGCLPSAGPGVGAVVTIPGDDLNVGETLTSTQVGTFFYRTESGATGSFSGPIPASLEGEYVVFWQSVSSGTDPIFAGVVGAIVLPVELISFYAKPQNCEVQLSWQTAIEINNAYFEVQRSRDGHTFETIGKLTGAGNSEMIQSYEFMDKKPMENSYYRLKQVDTDGQFEYSSIEIARINDCQIGTINVYPNPVANHLTVEATMKQADKGQISIYNYAGKEILNFAADLENGVNAIPVETTNLQAGIYFVRVMNDGQVSELMKFVKK